jgi:hypothetical protein
MVLVGVMLVLMIILAVGLTGMLTTGANAPQGGISDQTRNAMSAANRRMDSYGAQNLADAGVRAVMEWLNHQSSAPELMTPFRPSQVSSFFGATPNGNYDQITLERPDGTPEGTFEVRMYPFSDNDTNTIRSYVVESIGTYRGRQQIVRAVAVQDTFAKYAFFADNAPTNTWWSYGTTIFNGPVHINGRNMDPNDSANYDPNAKIKILWRSSGTASSNRIFRFDGDNAFTTSVQPNQVSWYKDNQANLASPIGSQWNHVAFRGAAGIQTATSYVDMPTQSTRQEDAALGNPPAVIPSGPGVTVPNNGGLATGGVYINGDVDDMNFSTSGTGNVVQTITIFQTDPGTGQKIRTTVTLDPLANGGDGSTTVQKAVWNGDDDDGSYVNAGPSQSFAGTTNGVIYTKGNIGAQTGANRGGVSGTIANNVLDGSGNIVKQNNLCIVTDANSNVNLDGNLTYRTLGAGGVPNNSSAVMGIVSKKVQIVRHDLTGTELGHVSLHATVLAYDTFDAVDPLTRNYLAVKNFTLLGGYIVNKSGTFAGIDAAGTVWTGFRINRNYDARLANRPPPYFPSTGNQYKIRSYERVGTTLQ